MWLGVLVAMAILAYPSAAFVAVIACRTARRRRDPAPGLRWQHCDWCDPAGDEALAPEDCTCTVPCTEEPMARWCAAAQPALRRPQ